jgi:hypothetical protein
MLKITYTSTGATLEHSCESLESILRRRVLVSLRVGEPLGLEPIAVSLLVGHSLPGLKALAGAIAQTPTQALALIQKSAAQVEMRLQGYWLAQQEKPGEGIFFATFDPALEGHLVKIWQESHQDVSCCL